MKELLAGKKGLIMGVATNHSIAWGISKLAHEMGASLAFSYPHDIFKGKIEKLLATLDGDHLLYKCDVSKENEVSQLMEKAHEHFGNFDFIVHSLAFSDKNELKGYYYNTTKKNFLNAMDISCYSFVEVCREALPYMNKEGSFLTLTHHGSQKVYPNYNVMGVVKAALEASVRYLAADLGEKGIRVNGISAGAIKTLAASAIGDFKQFLDIGEKFSPLSRNITLEDVAGMACFLLSDLAKGVTGGIHYVDCGINIMGCPKGGVS